MKTAYSNHRKACKYKEPRFADSFPGRAAAPTARTRGVPSPASAGVNRRDWSIPIKVKETRSDALKAYVTVKAVSLNN